MSAMSYVSAGRPMLTLRARPDAIIVMAARVVHRPARTVGPCLQDQGADEARRRVAVPALLAESAGGKPRPTSRAAARRR
jgi:hypothetical protein